MQRSMAAASERDFRVGSIARARLIRVSGFGFSATSATAAVAMRLQDVGRGGLVAVDYTVGRTGWQLDFVLFGALYYATVAVECTKPSIFDVHGVPGACIV